MEEIVFKQVFAQCPSGILITDRRLKVLNANKASHRILRSRVLIGVSLTELFDDVSKLHMATFSEYLHSGKQMCFSFKFRDPKLENWCELSATKIKDDSLEELIIWSLADISIHKQRETELELLAHYDGLTGAYTRHYFYHLANMHLQKYAEDKESFCILAMDLDDFKSINDHYGHSKGDEILQNFSALVAKNLRKNDLFGRIGGEEFAILLPNITPEMSHHIATRICQEVSSYFLQPKVTVSIGITAVDRDDDSIEKAIERADKALYSVKRNGKNHALLHCL